MNRSPASGRALRPRFSLWVGAPAFLLFLVLVVVNDPGPGQDIYRIAAAVTAVASLLLDLALYGLNRLSGPVWPGLAEVLAEVEAVGLVAEGDRIAFHAGESYVSVRQVVPMGFDRWEVVVEDRQLTTELRGVEGLPVSAHVGAMVRDCGARRGRLRVELQSGLRVAVVHTLDLARELIRGPWSGLRLPGLRHRAGGLRGHVGGFDVHVDHRGGNTLLRLGLSTDLRAGRELEGAVPTGNVVVDQLIGVNDAFVDSEELVGPLLEVVHGLNGRITAEGIVVETEGIIVDELPMQIEACVALARVLS